MKIDLKKAKINSLRRHGQSPDDLRETISNCLGLELENVEILRSNINYVARLRKFQDHSSSILKMVPAEGRLAAFPHISMPEERIIWDLQFNDFINKESETQHFSLGPKIYFQDIENKIVIMEDCADSTLRDYLRACSYDLDRTITIFQALAQYLADLYQRSLDPSLSREFFKQSNPSLTLHYKHLFVYPTQATDLVAQIWHDQKLSEEDITALKFWQTKILELGVSNFQNFDFLTNCQSPFVVHGDLHTASILYSKNSLKLIDGEFSTMAPISIDLGMFLANLYIDLAVADKLLFAPTIETVFLENFFSFSQKFYSSERLMNEINTVKLYEIIRQMIGASFAIPAQAIDVRESLFFEIIKLKKDLKTLHY